MLKMPVILIDNGHGKETPGKRSPDAVAGKVTSPYFFREFSWTRQCAQGIVDILQAEGYTAFLLVKEDTDVPLRERTERVKAYCRTYGTKNVLLVSVHVNAADKGQKWMSARGWSIYTSPGETASDKLATEIHAAAVPELTEREYARTFLPTSKQKAIRTDFSDGDPDYEAKFWMLTQTPCPAVLSENMFQDNKEDVAFLKSDQGLGACIQLHVQGIENYIEKYFKR